MTTHRTSLLMICTATLMLFACGGGGSTPSLPPGVSAPAPNSGSSNTSGTAKAPMISATDLTLGDIDKAMADKGKTTYDVKCQACHSLGENRIVGPGWKGVTTRRKPEWIMNMIMNTEAMLSDDPEAQKMLEQCLVRMPNQNLTKDEARQVLELMRTL